MNKKEPQFNIHIHTQNQSGGTNIGVQNTTYQLSSDTEVIRSIELRVVLESASDPKQPQGVSVGWANFCALFDSQKNRLRFGTDYKFEDRENNDRHQLILVYTPETPAELRGKPINFLADMQTLVFNVSDLLTGRNLGDHVVARITIFVNGLMVADITSNTAENMKDGQVRFDVGNVFAEIPASYRTAVAAGAAQVR